jgi:hypothetical protein
MRMSDQYTFDSQITLPEPRVPIRDDWPVEVIKNEPMLFNCSLDGAYRLGGLITRNILAALPVDWDESACVVDSRVHMLMPGWFPCIPGYHHDDVPRTRSDGQPDYDAPAYRADHLMVLVNGSVCPTEFAVGRSTFPRVPLGETIYKHWHKRVEADLASGALKRIDAPPNRFIGFDWQTWHQGTRARASGWRFFIRFTRNSDRVRSITNEVRRQVQVYLESPMEGW